MTTTCVYLHLLKRAITARSGGFVYSRNHKIMHRIMGAKDFYICQQCIPRISLLPISKSPWHRVYTTGDDQAMITLTGFDLPSFHFLLNLFAPLYDNYTPFIDKDGYIIQKVSLSRGRPRLMHPADCLGLVLAWSWTRGSLMVLQLIFGLTMTPVSKYLQFARRILVKILKANELAKICLPTHKILEEYRGMIQARHPVLDNVWGTMDGLKGSSRPLMR